ncbi:MAG: aminotransferase class I/II-fold pyridoxal phosphate-dependent enzyme [Jiangellaceae bacterium]|nr:aminotransferase class I/II-fold pyridoxal phosphate-dependent enzyme [Jiangellaceae bacterium]
MSRPIPEPDRYAPATVVVHAGRPDRVPDAPLSVPPVLASTFVEGGPLGYARTGNPTWTALEEVLGALEGGRALAFGSGMAAVAAVLDRLPPGAAVVAPWSPYGGVSRLLDQLRSARGVHVRRVDVADTEQTVAAMDGAALLWVESPTNPQLAVADLPVLFAAARERGLTSCADNTFATPLNQRPLDLGADVVVHSVTKYLAGHSDLVLGAAISRDDVIYEQLLENRIYRGAIPGPLETWIALRGVRTLHLRLERAQQNAAVLAVRLADHPRVVRLTYPGRPEDPGHARAAEQMRGFGAMIAFQPDGDAGYADRVCRATRLWVHATSLGGVESSLERRRRWAEESPTVPANLIRLSVGIEDVEDLWADLAGALDQAALP